MLQIPKVLVAATCLLVGTIFCSDPIPGSTGSRTTRPTASTRRVPTASTRRGPTSAPALQSVDRSVYVRSIPAVPGYHSNIYEIFLLPYDSTDRVIEAVTELKGADGVRGLIRLTQMNPPVGPVMLAGNVTGLSSGLHGFHVHEKGDLTGGCGSAGSHFNPYLQRHGAPTDFNRHVGDLGNIEADSNGEAIINFSDPIISLTGRRSIVGRAIVIHSGQDDLGRGRNEESLSTGNAGTRVACGIVGLL